MIIIYNNRHNDNNRSVKIREAESFIAYACNDH